MYSKRNIFTVIAGLLYSQSNKNGIRYKKKKPSPVIRRKSGISGISGIIGAINLKVYSFVELCKRVLVNGVLDNSSSIMYQ